MWTKEDNTYNEIRKKSTMQWLADMEGHADLEVRGGVTVTKDYIEYLELTIEKLKEENQLKNQYLKKAIGK